MLLSTGCGVVAPLNIRHGERELSFQKVSQIEAAKTTGQEVKDFFGEPNYDLSPPEWTYGRLSAWLGQSYYDKLQLRVDDKDLVQSFSYSQAHYDSFPLISASLGVKVNEAKPKDFGVLETPFEEILRELGEPALYSVQADKMRVVYAQINRFLFFTSCAAISAELDKNKRLTRLVSVDVPLSFMAIPFLPASETVGRKLDFSKFINCLDSGRDGKSFVAHMGEPQMTVRKESSERYMYGEFSMRSCKRGYVEYRQRVVIIAINKEKEDQVDSILFVNTADRRQVVSILGFASASDLLNSWSDLRARISRADFPRAKLRSAPAKRSRREYILCSLSEKEWTAKKDALRRRIESRELARRQIWKTLGEPNRIDIRPGAETWLYARRVGEKDVFFAVGFSPEGKAVALETKTESAFQYPDIILIVAQSFSF